MRPGGAGSTSGPTIRSYCDQLDATWTTSLEIVRDLGGWAWAVPIKLNNLADFASELGRPGEAERHARQTLELSSEIGDRITTAFSLAALAVAARARGDHELAGRLWGSIEAEEERTFLGQWPAYRRFYAGRAADAASPAFERARNSGKGLTLEEAVTLALEPSGPA